MPSFLNAQKLKSYLAFAERWARTDLRYLFAGGSWLAVSQIGIGLIAFGLSIAFAHFVPKDVYGTYRFLLSIFWTLTAFSLTGIPTALVRAIAQGAEGAYRTSFRLSILWSLPMGAISLCVSGYYFLHGNTIIGWGALLIALIGPLFQSSYLYGSFLEGKRDFKRNATAGILLNAVPAVGMLIAMFLTRSPLIFLSIYLGGSILTALCISWWIYRVYRPNKIQAPELLNFSAHLSAMNVLFAIASQLDDLLVYHYLGAVPLALYSFATAIPDQAKNVANNISTLAFPKFVQRSIAEIRRSLLYRLVGFTGLITVGTLVYIVLAPYIFEILFPTYMSAVFYSQLYALTLIPVGAIVPTTILQAHAETEKLYIYNILSAVFQIVAVFAGVLWAGIVGVIIARIVSRTFNLLFSLVLTYV